MPRAYLGQSGRVLPVPEGSDSLHTQQFRPGEAMPGMATYRLPVLPVPPGMQYGSDPVVGLTEPTRYGTTSSRRRTSDSSKQSSQEQLPSVSHLLTPGSLSSVGSSPFSQPFNAGSPTDTVSRQSSPRRSAGSDRYMNGNGQYYPAAVQSIPNAQIQYGHSASDPTQMMTNVSEMRTPPFHHSAYHSPVGYSTSPYPTSTETSHHTYPTLQTAHLPTSQQRYSRTPSSCDSATSSISVSGQSGHDLPTATKAHLRVVGEDVVPGEGPCYIYEDGSHVRKTIDGDVVNAQWGVTKAGKARKRLAIACITCREKKIRCEPGDVKCVQCDKSGRDCRFQMAPRGQHAGSNPVSYEPQARTLSSTSITTESHFHSLHSPHTDVPNLLQSPITERSSSAESRSSKRPPSPTENSESCTFRRRRPSQRHPKMRTWSGPEVTKPKQGKPVATGKAMTITPRDDRSRVDDSLAFEWCTDPYAVNPRLVLHYVDLYFIHVNSVTYCMFPKEPFLQWLQNIKMKTSDELMVVYSMLAMSTVFSPQPDSKAKGILFAKIARQAAEKSHGRFSLQLVQCRLLIGLYYFAHGDSAVAWDFSGSAFRAAVGLRFNLDRAIINPGDDKLLDYGLDKHSLAECHRRTYWSALTMDRYSGYCTGHFTNFSKENPFVQLPCGEEMYDKQEETTTPYFDNGISDPLFSQASDESPLGIMAYLVQITSIWGDVSAYLYRSEHWPRATYMAEYEKFHRSICARLALWHSSLPTSFLPKATNMAESLRGGYIGTFISIHSLYHSSFMMLNRYIRHAELPQDRIAHNIREAVCHAERLLFLMEELLRTGRYFHATSTATQHPHRRNDESHEFVFSTPFPGYAILMAIDILGAAGSTEASFPEVLRIMNNGLDIVRGLSTFWASAKDQKKAITGRIEGLANAVLDHGPELRAWVVSVPMEKTAGADQDVFYPGRSRSGAEGRVLLKALGVDTEEDEILHIEEGELRGSSPENSPTMDGL